MTRRVVIIIGIIAILSALSFYLNNHRPKEIVLKGTPAQFNQLMKAILMTKMEKWEADIVEDWVYKQVRPQMDSLTNK
jgi:hypothetical protein